MTTISAPRSWTVHVAGDQAVLEVLARIFMGPELQLAPTDDGEYRLDADSFSHLTNPMEVIAASNALLSRMCALANLYGNYAGEVWTASAWWEDEQGRSGGITNCRISITVAIPEGIERLSTRAPGERSTLATRLVAASGRDTTLESTLAVIGHAPLDWPRIYVLLEILKNQFGSLKGLSDFSGVSKTRLELLRRSANLYRHSGSERNAFTPLSFDDAEALTCALVQQWAEAISE